MKRFDVHIHTEATAPYQQGDANLEPYYQCGAKNNLDFMAITDHYHYFWQATRYVQDQRKHLQAHTYSKPKIFLGVEQTILSKSGRIGIRESGRKFLDFIILTIHWMPIGGRLGHERINQLLTSPEQTVKLFEIAKLYYQNVILNPKIAKLPKIIGHPFNFIPIKSKNLPIVADAFDWLCEYCSKHDVAYEINLDSVPRDLKNIDEHYDEFWKHLVECLNAHSTKISLASDAHHLENIGKIDSMLTILERYKFHTNQFIDEAFFSPN